jgi:hypothetical protein
MDQSRMGNAETQTTLDTRQQTEDKQNKIHNTENKRRATRKY